MKKLIFYFALFLACVASITFSMAPTKSPVRRPLPPVPVTAKNIIKTSCKELELDEQKPGEPVCITPAEITRAISAPETPVTPTTGLSLAEQIAAQQAKLKKATEAEKKAIKARPTTPEEELRKALAHGVAKKRVEELEEEEEEQIEETPELIKLKKAAEAAEKPKPIGVIPSTLEAAGLVSKGITPQKAEFLRRREEEKEAARRAKEQAEFPTGATEEEWLD